MFLCLPPLFKVPGIEPSLPLGKCDSFINVTQPKIIWQEGLMRDCVHWVGLWGTVLIDVGKLSPFPKKGSRALKSGDTELSKASTQTNMHSTLPFAVYGCDQPPRAPALISLLS